MEIWKDINGYEGLYQVSNLGRVKSMGRYRRGLKKYFQKEKILCPVNGNKYLHITLVSKTGVKATCTIHSLTASAFLIKDHSTFCVNHKDGNPHNNNIENLEWVSYSRNGIHAYEIGLNVKTFGEATSSNKLSEIQVKEIRLNYQPAFGAIIQIARKYNITRGQVYNILNRKSWPHV